MKPLFTFFLALLALSATAQGPTQGLILHFPFDNVAGSGQVNAAYPAGAFGTTHSATTGNSVTALGSTGVDGTGGGSIAFDRAQILYINNANTPDELYTANNWTISFFVRWTELNAESNSYNSMLTLGGVNNSNETGFYIRTWAAGDSVAGESQDSAKIACSYTSKSNPGAVCGRVQSEPTQQHPFVSRNTWTHIALVRSGQSVNVYVGGVLANTISIQTFACNDFMTLGANFNGFTSGQTNPNGTFRFKGQIDELRVYNRGMTGSSLDSLRNRIAEGTSSVSENLNTLALRAYPNPTSNSLTVELPTAEPATHTVQDVQGRTVLTHTTTARTATLPTESLAPGVYVLHTVQNGQHAVLRFVRQ